MHVIRLRKPWDRTDAPSAQRRRIDVPEPIDADEARSAVSTATYQRRFNRPTGLQPGTRVAMRITDWSGELQSLSLNGRELPVGPAPLEVDLSDQLQPHNRLELSLSPDSDAAPRLSGEVTLVIDE